MKKFDYYKESTDYVWYDSSDLLFSEAKENPNGTLTLKVVFKKGQVYLYQNVDMTDYLLVKNSPSNGTAFAKVIAKKVNNQPKYQYLKLSDVNVEEIDALMQQMIEESQKQSVEFMSDTETAKSNENTTTSQPDAKPEFSVSLQKGEKLFAIVRQDEKEVGSFEVSDMLSFYEFSTCMTNVINALNGRVKIEVGE